jgi:hypothetical protein
MKVKINKMIQKKEQKKNTNIEKKTINPYDNIFMDNTSNAFNIIANDQVYDDWRKVSVDKKLEILEDYFQNENAKFSVPFDDNIKNELRENIGKNKILYKKDIIYDKINKKILDIPLVKYENNIFILRSDEKKVNIKKQSLNNVNKLLKKNN